jgi:hypothetical protein
MNDGARYDATFGNVFRSALQQFGALYNTATGEGTNLDKSIHAQIKTGKFLSREDIRGLLVNSWIAQKAVSAAPTQAVRRGLRLAFKDKDKLEGDVKAELEAIEALKYFKEGLCAARAFGGAAILLMVNDGQTKEDGQLDVSRPLYNDDGSFLGPIKELKGLFVIEGGRDGHLSPAMIAPDWAQNGAKTPPLVDWRPGKGFAKPLWWEWNPSSEHNSGDEADRPEGVLIHRDRLIFFKGVYTDKETRQILGGWDLGILDAGFTPLRNYESSQTSMINIVYDFFTVVAKVRDFKKIVAGGETAELVDRFEANALARSILHMYICDAVDEDITKVGSPVTGLEGLVDKFMDAVAGAFRMPRSMMFMEAPRGAGKDEAGLEFWEQDIESIQIEDIAPGIRVIIDILEAAEKRPSAERMYSVGFFPLRRPSLKEEAEAARTYAHADEINVKDGIYTRKEARGRHMGVGGISELKLDGEEPPEKSEFMDLSQSVKPGFQREAGENTEAEGKVPNSGQPR